MMKRGFISLGFLVVAPHTLKGWEDESVPPIFYTPSSCLCDIYPDTDLLNWKGNMGDTAQYATLGLTPEHGGELLGWLNSLFEDKRWGFDSAFVHLDDVQEFVQRWVGDVADRKILEMALPAAWLEEFLSVHVLENGKDTHQGRYFAARLMRPTVGRPLGFEVLGVNPWSNAHTSACSDVRKDFRAGFDATFNAYGFLTTLEQAELAAREYMFESDGSGIEDCAWFPIQVSEVQWQP